MVYEELENAKSLMMSKDNILLLTHQKMDADGLSSMLALGVLLGRLGKQIKILSTDPVPDIYEFLPFTDKVSVSQETSNDFVISIKKTGGLEIDRLRYNNDDHNLNIIITPKEGKILEDNINFKKAVGNYDLIITMDTGDLDHLGKIYNENVEMFYNTPIINIDHHVTNTGFGQINLVDTTASSSTEIIYELFKHFSENWQELIDEDIATLLMTGLITDTGSFRHTNTSPRSLELAADLMEMGARQQEIIKNIYKTKHLSTLKIWGRVLSKIQEDPIHRMVWSTVTKEDIKETGSAPEETEELIDELMSNAPGAEFICLFKDSLDGVLSVSMRTSSITIDATDIAKHFGGGGHKQAAGFKIKNFKSFDLEVGKVIAYIQDYQKERLGITDDDIAQLEIESKKEDEKEPSGVYKDIEEEGSTLSETGVTFPSSLTGEQSQDANKDAKSIDGVVEVEEGKPAENNQDNTQEQAKEPKGKQEKSIEIKAEVKKGDAKATKRTFTVKEEKIKQDDNKNVDNKGGDKEKKNNVKKTEDSKKQEKKAIETEEKKEVDSKQKPSSKKPQPKKKDEKVEGETKQLDSSKMTQDVKEKGEDSAPLDKKQSPKKKGEDAKAKQGDLSQVDVSRAEDAQETIVSDEVNQEEVNNPTDEAQADGVVESIDQSSDVTPDVATIEQSDQAATNDNIPANQPAQDAPDDVKITVKKAPEAASETNQPAVETVEPIQAQQPVQQPTAQTQTAPSPQTAPQQAAQAPVQQQNAPQQGSATQAAVQQPAPTQQSQPQQQQPQGQGHTAAAPPAAQPQAQSPQQAAGAQGQGGLVSPQEADGYARRFYELIKTVDPNSAEYKKYYEGYIYYAKIAGWQV